MDKSDYEVYVEDLMPYHVADIEAVCLSIGREERGEGDTAFPPIGRLIDDLRAVEMARALQDKATREQEERQELERAARERPEDFIDMREFWNEASERFAAKFGASRGPEQKREYLDPERQREAATRAAQRRNA